MKRNKHLRKTLESLTQVYHSEKTVVEFGSHSKAVPPDHSLDSDKIEQPTVVINPNVQERFCQELTGPEELRCITNTLSHELEHIRETELTSKAGFMEEYGNHRQFAGGVINILEDQYIDFRRTHRFPGLRSTQAFVIDKLIQDDDQWPRISQIEEPSRAMLEGLRQVAFAGYAKGISEAESWLREFLSRTRSYIKKVRYEPSQRQRKELAHSLMQVAQEYLPNNDDLHMPAKCAVCEEREPVIVAPRLGPVCDKCAPTGHGRNDGDGTGEMERNNIQPATPETASTVATHETGGEVTQSASGRARGQGTNFERDEISQHQRNLDSGESDHERHQTRVSSNQKKHGQPESAELVTMEEMDVNQDSGSWWNVPEDVDHQTASQEDVSRFERIRSQELKNQSLEATLQQNREKSKKSNESLSPQFSEHSSNLQESEEWERLREEHRRMFRKLMTQDMPIPSNRGDRVNLDNAVQQVAGDKSQRKVYNKKQKVDTGNRLVAISADLSGSMSGRQVKLALAAIAEATEMVGDDFLATFWKNTSSSTACGYNRGLAGIGLVCGVDEKFKWEQLDEFQSSGGTPIADGIDVTTQLMKDTHAREKLMIVITDGEANTEYGEEDEELTGGPVADAAQVVRNAQYKNVKIIGLYLNGDLSSLFENSKNSFMSDIFGEDGFVIASVDSLAKELIKIYRQQLAV